MAFKKLRSLESEVTIALGGLNKKTNKPNPTKVEGYYLGSRKVDDKKKKSGFSYIHFLETEKGIIGVWGKTNLDNQIKNVTPGVCTRITQAGKRATPNGDMYLFTVEVDADNTTDVSDLASDTGVEADFAGAEEGNGGGYDDGAEEAELDEDEAPLDETPPSRPAARAAAVAPDAARQAKVQAMLAGKGGRKTA